MPNIDNIKNLSEEELKVLNRELSRGVALWFLQLFALKLSIYLIIHFLVKQLSKKKA